MNKELISVIIPTYNRGNTVVRSINSVLNQTYKNLELIIVDDGSTDNTKELINNIKDFRLKYYRFKKNKGACAARNYGISVAKGDYIAFQDSDDVWLPNKLDTQLLNIKKKKSMVDFCSYIRLMDGKKKKMPSFIKILRFRIFGIKNELLFGNFISTQLLLFNRKCIENFEFDQNLSRFQDWDLMLRISNHYKISFTKKILVKTYVQNDSITKSTRKLVESVNIMLEKKYNEKDYKIHSTLYSILASNDTNNKKDLYILSLKKYFRIKNFIKYLLNY